MSTDALQPIDSNWAERHGGWILSVCFHVLLFVWLLTGAIRNPVTVTPEPRRVRLVLNPPEPAPAPPLPVEPAGARGERDDLPTPPLEALLPGNALRPPAAPPASSETPGDSTVPSGVQLERFTTPPPPELPSRAASEIEALPEEGDLAIAPAKALTDLPDLEQALDEADARQQTLSEVEERKIAEILETYGSKAPPVRKEVFDRSKSISRRLDRTEVATAAFPHFPDYELARKGPIRDFNLNTVSEEVRSEIMERYQITRTRRVVSNTTKNSFLNSASIGNSIYQSADRAGYSEVLRIPDAAARKLATLEYNWLIANGYDPRSTRVDTVVFGIVRTENAGWDLGILHITVQSLTEVGKPVLVEP